MHFIEAFKMALKCIFLNRLRSFLTMLGIIIGVASIIAIIGVISSLRDKMTENFNDQNKVYLTASIAGRNETNRKVTLDSLKEFSDSNKEVISAVFPDINREVTLKYDEKKLFKANLVGSSDQQKYISRIELAKGRFLIPPDLEQRSNVAILNSNLELAMFQGEESLQKEVKINGHPFVIVGVIADKYQFDERNVIYIPYTTAVRQFSASSINSFVIKAASNKLVYEARERTNRYLSDIFGSTDVYHVSRADDILSELNKISLILNLLLGGIAAISLAVAGIGVMNIMLVSVTERTREIGIRKALGATQGNIKIQFLIEAALLSGVGGVIGILMGVVFVKSAGFFANLQWGDTIGKIEAGVPLGAIILAFAFSCSIGVFFGWMPAGKAARMTPIKALRSE